MNQVTLEEINDQRLKGWPDFHPEAYCHECGRENIIWHSPEWVQIMGSHSGILCPVCFAKHAPETIWRFSRNEEIDANKVKHLTDLLRVVSDLGDDSERVARCVLDLLEGTSR